MSVATIHREGRIFRQVHSELPPVTTEAGTAVVQEDAVAFLGPAGEERRRLPLPAGCQPEAMQVSADGSTVLLRDESGAQLGILGDGGQVRASRDKLIPLAGGEMAVATFDKLQVFAPDGSLAFESTGRVPSYRIRADRGGRSLYFCEETRAASWFGGGWSMGSSLMRYRPGHGVERLGAETSAEPLQNGSYLEVGDREVVHRSDRGSSQSRLSFGYREYLDRVKVSPDERVALVSTRGAEGGDRKLYRLDLEKRSSPELIHRSDKLFEAWFGPEGEITLEKPLEEPAPPLEFPAGEGAAPALQPRGQVHFLLQDRKPVEPVGSVGPTEVRIGEEQLELSEGDRVTAALSFQVGEEWLLAAGTAQGRVLLWEPSEDPVSFTLQGAITGFSALGNQVAASSAEGEVLLFDAGAPVAQPREGGPIIAERNEAVVIGGVRLPRK